MTIINYASHMPFMIQSHISVIVRSRFRCGTFYAGRLALIRTSDIAQTKVAQNRSEILFLSLLSIFILYVNGILKEKYSNINQYIKSQYQYIKKRYIM